MRRFLPRSLAGWAILIVIAALTVTEITTLIAIAQSRSTSTQMKGLFQLAERVTTATRLVADDKNAADRGPLAAGLGDSTLAIGLEQTPLASGSEDETLTELAQVLLRRLNRAGVVEVHVDRHDPSLIPGTAERVPPARDAGPVERALSSVSQEYSVADAYVVSVKLQDGTWLNFVNKIADASSVWTLEALALALGVIAVVLLASTWALRQLTGPYAVLARAAERFGVDLNTPPLAETGPREVRSAAHAFNLMRGRLKRMMEDRDQMVAAVSHDIRTPVTRLRLRAEAIADPEQRERVLSDLAEIETMTQSVLALASDAAQPEQRQLIDLVSLLESLCTDASAVTLSLDPQLPGRVPCWAQPVALRRCVSNLLGNAVKYGKAAQVSLAVGPDVARIVIDDDGPGIPTKDFERIFRPFVRLEASRNRGTGGTGLGLTIARSVARSHGGDVTLSNRPEGGLRAVIALPLSDDRRPTAAPAVAPAQSPMPAPV